MADLWPWLAVAGIGALHGSSPANGWMFAAACGLRAHDTRQAQRALLPIAAGHAASVALVAGAVAWGMSLGNALERTLLERVAGALLIAAASWRLLRGVAPAPQRGSLGMQAGHAGIALWSFLMATAHGAGLMLVPALVPLCIGAGPMREITASGSLLLALAAVGVHMAAMLLATGLIATGLCRGIARWPRLSSGPAAHRAGTAALAVTGVWLMALR